LIDSFVKWTRNYQTIFLGLQVIICNCYRSFTEKSYFYYFYHDRYHKKSNECFYKRRVRYMDRERNRDRDSDSDSDSDSDRDINRERSRDRDKDKNKDSDRSRERSIAELPHYTELPTSVSIYYGVSTICTKG